MANNTVYEVAAVIIVSLVLSFSCSRKMDVSVSCPEGQLRDIQSRFDSCKAVLCSLKEKSFVSDSYADSVLAAVKGLLDLPYDVLSPGQIRQQAKHYVIASSLYVIKNEVDSAFIILEKGLSFYRNLSYGNESYAKEYCDISTAMTILFSNYAMYTQADKYANQAIEAAKSLDDSARLCFAYANKSWVADRVAGGGKDTAFHYVSLARQWRPVDNLFLYYVLESYAGHIYVTSLDSVAVGISNLLELEKVYSAKHTVSEGLSYIPYNIGMGYMLLGEDGIACKYFERALEGIDNEPDVIKREVLDGIVEYYISNNMTEAAIGIIPELMRLSALRSRAVSEWNMAYLDSHLSNVKLENELQFAKNNLQQRTIENSVLILLVVFSVLLIIFMIYRVIRYKRKVSALYSDLQCSHSRWLEHTASHMISADLPESHETEDKTINLIEEKINDEEEKQHMRVIYERVKAVMEKDKPFLSPQFDLSELAQMVYSNRSQLSAAINRFYGTNFSNFVSEYRVNYFMEMLNGSDVRIEEMWPKAGFPSRSSFYRQFHAVTKLTPAQYLEQKLKQEKNKQ